MEKLTSHYVALEEYHGLINELVGQKNIYDPAVFQSRGSRERAVLDAYLKRYSSLQDYMGTRIFPLLLENAGITAQKMTDVLAMVEREGIIDGLSEWIELRESRNALEHDYHDDLVSALSDLRACVANFSRLGNYYRNTMAFASDHSLAP